MDKINARQMKRLFHLLGKHGLTETRDEVLLNYTDGRTGSAADLTNDEAEMVILLLETNAGNATAKAFEEEEKQKCNVLVRKLLAKFHALEWHIYDAEIGRVRMKDGKRMLDYNRINNWCIKHTPAHKMFKDQNSRQLADTITIVNKMVIQFNQKIQSHEENQS